MFFNYSDAYEYARNARNLEKGRPLKTNGRIYLKGKTVEFHLFGTPVARISPDNLMTFVVTPEEIERMGMSYSMCIDNLLPIYWSRKRRHIYNLRCRKNIDWASLTYRERNLEWQKDKKNAEWSEYFTGIMFDLTTGACLNPQAPMLSQINNDKRKTWLSSRKKWVNKIKTMAKLGVFDGYKGRGSYLRIVGEPQLDLLYNSINSGVVCSDTKKILEGSAMAQGWFISVSKSEGQMIIESAERLLKTYSVELRQRFGVFTQEGE